MRFVDQIFKQLIPVLDKIFKLAEPVVGLFAAQADPFCGFTTKHGLSMVLLGDHFTNACKLLIELVLQLLSLLVDLSANHFHASFPLLLLRSLICSPHNNNK